MNRSLTMAKGVGSALLLVLILAGLPVVLVRVGAFPSSVPDPASLWRAARGPDPSGRAVFVVLAALVWLAWATFTLSVLRETVAAMRSHGLRPARPLPGLGWSARPAAALIGAIIAMVVTGPLLTASDPQAAAAGLRSTFTDADRHALATVATAPHDPVAAAGQTIAATGGHPSQGHPQPASARAAQVAAPADPEQASAPPPVAASEDRGGLLAQYTVKRRDTLWSIAERHLGDPLRYREIAAINQQIGPDYQIHPGQVLTLPGVERATPPGATQVTVKRGDTLSGIARDHSIADWHAVWAANAGRAEPGGKRFTNPHHIEIGWQLTVAAAQRNPPVAPAVPSSSRPSPPSAPAAPEARHGPAVPEHPAATAADPSPRGTSTEPLSSPADPIPAPAATGPSTGNGSQRTDSEPVTGPQAVAATAAGLAAGGVVLAAGVFAALALARRQRFRDRQPGRTLASPDPTLIPVERASVTLGGPAAAEVARLDEVLRRLAASDIEIPHLAAVQLSAGDITVHLACPACLPDPWRPTDADGLAWAFPAAADVEAAGADPQDVGAIAPYPTLVHVGSDAGSMWLLNLEHTGGLVLSGDPDRCLNLARVMAAQLVLNPWAEAISVTMLGLGEELVDAAPARLRYAAPADADVELAEAFTGAVRTADFADHHQVTVLDARRRAVADETWAPHVLLVDAGCLAGGAGGTDSSVAALSRLRDLVQTRVTATGTVVVLVAAEPGAAGSGAATVGYLNPEGTLTLPDSGLTITACGWDADTAAGVGMLLAHVRTAEQEKVPDATGEQPWQAFADAAGALREQLVQPRATPGVHERNQPETCTLPLADDVYLDAAATTREDLQALAPNVPAEVRPQVESADPTLDADVAAWFDPASARAKLSLLGPLTLRGHRPASERPAFYAELTAYLATRPHGASVDQIVTAFSLAAGSARSYLSTLRELLGDDPTTGLPYLPHADKSTAAKTRGVNIYQLNALLVDADLFRRLRLRGQARGQAGIDDYVTALRLVTGEPFSQMREGGGAWLLEGDRHDQHLSHAIVDVAHLVATHALAAGDCASARAAVDIARLAAPYEETPRLDTAAVEAAEGRTDRVRSSLTDQVCNRSDDGQPPPELNSRTKQILARHRDWLSQAS